MSSQDLILRLVEKKFHHQLDETSIEEILEVLREISMELGILQARADVIRGNQKFISDLLLRRIKEGVE